MSHPDGIALDGIANRAAKAMPFPFSGCAQPTLLKPIDRMKKLTPGGMRCQAGCAQS
jgi:hypothetical protein